MQFSDELANKETIRMAIESSCCRACGQMGPRLPIGRHIPRGPESNFRQYLEMRNDVNLRSCHNYQTNKRITLFFLALQFVSAYGGEAFLGLRDSGL